MASMYELRGNYRELLERIQEGADPDVIRDTLEALEGEIEVKADNYAKIIKQLESDIGGLKAEIERLSDRKRALENHVASLKGNLEDTMILTGKEKFRTELFSFGIQNNPASVVIDDPTSIPEEFLIPQEPKADKKGMKDYLKDHQASWGHLEQTRGLRIR